MSDRHFKDCWRQEDHPSCRLAYIHQLEREVARLTKQNPHPIREPAQPIPWSATPMGKPIPVDIPPNRVTCAGVVINNPMPLTASGPVPCFTEGLVAGVPMRLPQMDEANAKAFAEDYAMALMQEPITQRIPGSASWTAPAVDSPPCVLDPEHPHP